ncbi:hypothetical protein [Streptomyces sp. NPDC057002]|uniref:hypothetical protein n=1 Tax=Streptomyces sp. NPDC057002 TaxID=3345992 RepID=UPI00363A7FAA
METRPESPEPQGDPRWVAMLYRPAARSWRPAAESPHRSPVLYALGEMTQTMRARGDEVTVALWGPKDGAWHLFDTPSAQAASPSPSPSPSPQPRPGAESPGEPTVLTERMTGRRHQVLMAGLGKAGLYDLTPEDETTVQALVERLDEPAVRRVAHWLAAAGTR